MKTEHAEALKGRVLDYLHAEGFRSDDLLYVRAFVTHDRSAVYVSMADREFRCAACRGKGLLEKLADSFNYTFRRAWCQPCNELWRERFDLKETRSADLKRVLGRAFAIELSLPDNPISAVLVTG